MFTGIVMAIGRLAALVERSGDLELGIDAGGLEVGRLETGDSVSVQGVCLTVTRKQGSVWFADVSRETLSKTTLGGLKVLDRVNLEPALRMGDPLGGHWVSGHVDAVGTLESLKEDARSRRLVFSLPPALMRFVAPKGSICVDGVSLTVGEVGQSSFDVNIIPHTLQATTLGALEVGAGVNIEIDVVARYLDRLIVKTAE